MQWGRFNFYWIKLFHTNVNLPVIVHGYDSGIWFESLQLKCFQYSSNSKDLEVIESVSFQNDANISWKNDVHDIVLLKRTAILLKMDMFSFINSFTLLERQILRLKLMEYYFYYYCLQLQNIIDKPVKAKHWGRKFLMCWSVLLSWWAKRRAFV